MKTHISLRKNKKARALLEEFTNYLKKNGATKAQRSRAKRFVVSRSLSITPLLPDEEDYLEERVKAAFSQPHREIVLRTIRGLTELYSLWIHKEYKKKNK
jgi:hypothetical protein